MDKIVTNNTKDTKDNTKDDIKDNIKDIRETNTNKTTNTNYVICIYCNEQISISINKHKCNMRTLISF